MTHIIPEGMKLAEVSKLPGVADLKLSARGPFAKALIAERDGNHDKAEELLGKACAA